MDYFKEFLMVFLAVTMGFLAENIRERLLEESRVMELAGQLREDLTSDTMKIQRHIDFQTMQVQRADSLCEILRQPSGRIDYQRLQNMIVDFDRLDYFYPSSGAMTTIKNELHLKRFVKTKITTYIDNYEKGITVLQKFEDRDLEYMGRYLENFISKHFTPENIGNAVTRAPVVNGVMRELKPEDLTQLCVDVNMIKAYNMRLLFQYKKLKTDATEFIDHIKKTYKMDD